MVTSPGSTTARQKQAVDAHLSAASQHAAASHHHQAAAHELGHGKQDDAREHVAAATDHSAKAHEATTQAVKHSGKAN